MARPKKTEDKPKDASSMTISAEDFVRTRDSVVTGLATLQSAVSDLSRAYIAHTNTILGKGASVSFEQINFTTPLGGENGLFSARAATPATAPEQPVEGKKRKRAPHDKNAPKRALTPFFLYLQNQRATITQELGENCTAKEVQDEGGKRWREMAQKEKDKWQEEYGVNFARYQEHMRAYKEGRPIPEISDAEAKKLYERNQKEKAAKAAKAPGAAADATPAVAAAVESEEDSDEETPEPAKEPTPPPSKKQKTTKESAKKKGGKADEVVATPTVAVPASDKKKKGGKKDKDAAPPASTPAKAAEAEKPKKKGRKHKSGELEM